MAKSNVVDGELLGYLGQTGQRAYGYAQLLAKGWPSERAGLTGSEYVRVALLIRICVARLLPAMAAGGPARLTPDERETLVHLGKWARHGSSRLVQRKLRAFVAHVRRLPVYAEAS